MVQDFISCPFRQLHPPKSHGVEGERKHTNRVEGFNETVWLWRHRVVCSQRFRFDH